MIGGGLVGPGILKKVADIISSMISDEGDKDSKVVEDKTEEDIYECILTPEEALTCAIAGGIKGPAICTVLKASTCVDWVGGITISPVKELPKIIKE